MWTDRGRTYDDVSSFDELFAGLEDDRVGEVDEVGEHVQAQPQRDGALGVVGEAEAGCDEPGVVVEGQRHHAEPGDVATVSERVHGDPQHRVHRVFHWLQHGIHR